MSSPASSATHIRDTIDAWERLRGRAVALLQHEAIDPAWVGRLTALASEVGQTAELSPDTGLYLLLNEKVNEPDHYSGLHALACAMIARLAARWLEWPDEDVAGVAHVALSMNIGMGKLQDELALQKGDLSDEQKAAVAGHAGRSADMLETAGVDDAIWLQAVRLHHTAAVGADAESQSAERRVAELVRRIDVYVAKLSRRKARKAVTPAIAARDACLGPAGHPDAMGMALLRVTGLYPPGTYVELANGELGVVTQRGTRAHTPMVAALKRWDGAPYLPPHRLDTSARATAVKRGVEPTLLKVYLNHAAVLRCVA